MIRLRFVPAISAALARCVGAPWRFDGCALFAADIIRDVLGYDPAADWRGRYTTARGMRRILGRGGLPAAVAGAARRHGWRRVDPAMARPGDVALMRTPDGPAVAIRHERFFVGPVARGFAAHDVSAIEIVWSIA